MNIKDIKSLIGMLIGYDKNCLVMVGRMRCFKYLKGFLIVIVKIIIIWFL